jgi:hypothetical protein
MSLDYEVQLQFLPEPSLLEMWLDRTLNHEPKR